MTQIVCLQVGGSGRCNCQCNCNNCTRGRLTVVPRGVFAGNAPTLYLISVPVSSNLCASVFLGNSSWATTRIITRSHSHSFIHSFIHLSLIAKDEEYKTLVTFSAAACGVHLLFPYFPTFAGCISLIVLLVLIDAHSHAYPLALTCTHWHSQQLQMNRYFDCIERFIIC